jgi:hypothetical protein
MSWADLVGVVAPEVLANAESTSRKLGKLGVPHAVIGGLAVGVLGYPRATRDVAFLIGREGEPDANSHGFRKEVMDLYDKDVVDFLTVRKQEPDQRILLDALRRIRDEAGTIPVVGAKELVWLKLSTPEVRRQHDLNDLRQLLRAGAIDPHTVLDWLDFYDPTGGKVEAFSELVDELY